MPPASTEDTIILPRPTRAGSLFNSPAGDADASNTRHALERCRAKFRELGERMSSFDLSRQIYG